MAGAGRNNIKKEDREKFNLLIIQLDNKTTTDANKLGRGLKWYGKRLTILRSIYNKTIIELCVFFNVSSSTLSSWETNKVKPSKEEIERLAFLFEVNPSFFTDKNVNVTINEQLTIKENGNNLC